MAASGAGAYGPLCALFYDADKPAAPADEVAWYAQRLPRDAGPVLEPMCGSGRLLVPLVAAGFNVHGVDTSAAMLAHCESRLAGARRRSTRLPTGCRRAEPAVSLCRGVHRGGFVPARHRPCAGARRPRAHPFASRPAGPPHRRPVRPGGERAADRRAARRGAHGHARRTARESRCGRKRRCIPTPASREPRAATCIGAATISSAKRTRRCR